MPAYPKNYLYFEDVNEAILKYPTQTRNSRVRAKYSELNTSSKKALYSALAYPSDELVLIQKGSKTTVEFSFYSAEGKHPTLIVITGVQSIVSLKSKLRKHVGDCHENI